MLHPWSDSTERSPLQSMRTSPCLALLKEQWPFTAISCLHSPLVKARAHQ